MKLLTSISTLTLCFALLPSSAWALTMEIQVRNGDVTIFDIPNPVPGSTVGSVTVAAFESHNIPFQGSEEGIASIRGITNEMEPVSDNVLKAWGWCYSVDGHVFDLMPDKVTFNSGAGVLKWFYAYALYDSGTWTGYCIQEK